MIKLTANEQRYYFESDYAYDTPTNMFKEVVVTEDTGIAILGKLIEDTPVFALYAYECYTGNTISDTKYTALEEEAIYLAKMGKAHCILWGARLELELEEEVSNF